MHRTVDAARHRPRPFVPAPGRRRARDHSTVLRDHRTARDRTTLPVRAAATELPLLAYDIPVCVHTKLSVDLVTRLVAEGAVAGVKDSSGDDVAFKQLLLSVANNAPEASFSALTGHEIVVDAMMLAGASGAVPGLANVDPAGYVRLYNACVAGDWATARVEQDRLTRLFRIVDAADPATAAGATRGVGAFKTALALLGVIDGNAVSLPLRALDAEETSRVRTHLEQAGLL